MTEKHPLEVMGGRIADIQDRMLPAFDVLSETKKQVLFTPEAYERSRWGRRPMIAMAVAAGIAAMAVVSWVFFSNDSRLGVTFGGEVLAEGDWISKVSDTDGVLNFSDGSTITLHPQSGVRVQGLHARGAHLLLERGAVDAAVIHRADTRWQLDVGPYVVKVTGTRFTASWDPETEIFSLEMLEGSVDVSGPMIASGKSLGEGETLSAELSSGRLEFRTGKGRRVVSTEETKESESADDGSEAVVITVDDGRASASEVVEETDGLVENQRALRRSVTAAWRKPAAAGDHKGVMQAVGQVGVGPTLSEASGDDLLVLGDAARHTGDIQLATRFYKTALRRYHGKPQATRAAFSLGIMAFDQKGAYQEAAKWFSKIADRRTSGGLLVKEASGRLIEAFQKAGDQEKARDAAQRYLEKYPSGPHAALAKRLTK